MNPLLSKITPDRIVFHNESILSVLKKMDKSLRKLYVVYEDNKYIGLISMGDIQRAIIRDIPLESSIGSILRKKNRIAHIKDSFHDIKKIMIEFRMEFMPILDDNNNLTGIYLWEELFNESFSPEKHKMNTPVVIMAGGKGSRLKPITNILPKPLIPIGDKTIIETIIESFEAYGCTNFNLSLNYKADFIVDYLNNYFKKKDKTEISYFKEEKPLGTAGSLFLLKGKLKNTFFISNCDIIVDQDYSEILEYHRANKNELTLVAALKHYTIPYGTIQTGDNGELLNLSEKPELTYKINSGLYIVEPHLLDEIPDNSFFHITTLIENIIARKGKVGVFPVAEGAWKDIGEWDEYLKNYKK